jgi:hypothetical protein
MPASRAGLVGCGDGRHAVTDVPGRRGENRLVGKLSSEQDPLEVNRW